MDQRTPFDHRPDPAVGTALRQLLTAPDDATFVARVMAAAARPGAARSPLDVLAGWARPGIAAAVLAAVVSGFAIGRRIAPQESLDEAMATSLLPSPASAAIAESEGPPDGGVIFATFVDP
jgi:hypothetical protein